MRKLDPEINSQIEEVSRKRGITPETLVNIWLVEFLSKMKVESIR